MPAAKCDLSEVTTGSRILFRGWTIQYICPSDAASNHRIGNKVKPEPRVAKTAHCDALKLVYSIIHVNLLSERSQICIDGKEGCQRRNVHSSETRAPLRIHGSLSRKRIVFGMYRFMRRRVSRVRKHLPRRFIDIREMRLDPG